MGGDRAQMYFFFFKFATKSLEKKKGPVAHPSGDHPVGPPGGPVAPPAGDRGGPTGDRVSPPI